MRAAIVATASCVLLLAGCGDSDRKALEAQLAQLRQQSEKLTADLDAARKNAATATSGLGEISDRVATLTKDLDAAKQLAATAKGQYDEASRQLQSVKAEAEGLKTALTKSVSDASAAAQKYEKDIADLKKQIADLTARLAEAARGVKPGGLKDLLPGSVQPPPATPPAAPPANPPKP
jgi:chromosome segregation ATPase